MLIFTIMQYLVINVNIDRIIKYEVRYYDFKARSSKINVYLKRELNLKTTDSNRKNELIKISRVFILKLARSNSPIPTI